MSPLTSLQGKTLPRQVTTSTQVRQAVKIGQAGNVTGTQPGIGPPRPPRRTVLPPKQIALHPRKAILSPLIGSSKGLPQKTLAQSGSLTYPANS